MAKPRRKPDVHHTHCMPTAASTHSSAGLDAKEPTLYSDLLCLKPDAGGRLPIELLRPLGLPIPDDVLEQFCSDHATNCDFQEQYGHLNLRIMSWQLQELRASQIAKATVFEEFRRWTSGVTNRLRHFEEDGWSCIDVRPNVVEHWREHRTWIRPPVFLAGELVGRGPDLHLVEGHTRFGVLIGLLQAGALSAESIHRAWVGTVAGPDSITLDPSPGTPTSVAW